MNEKGQTLVLFILIFPVLIIILIVTANFMKISQEKTQLNQIIYDTTKFIIDNQNQDDILNKSKKIIEQNTSDTVFDIDIDETKVTVEATKQLGHNILNIDSSIHIKYIGDLNTKRIEKSGD